MTRELDNRVKLTQKQEQFCVNIAVKKMLQAEAYRNSYDAENMNDNTVNHEAYLLMQSPQITARIQELRNSTLLPLVMNEIKRKVKLSQIGESRIETPVTASQVINAITELNKMDGIYKTETGTTQTIINIIVPDGETKNLLSGVEDNTKTIETGYKLLSEPLPDAPE
jgi:hypothetical protein